MLFGHRPHAIQRILIVEDEPLVAFDNEHFLVREGYVVVATVDSLEGARIAIETGAPDIVLADIALRGGGDGVDVARIAGAHGVPVLFVTGHCPLEARVLAVGCLAKPYTQRDLLGAIEAVEARLAGRPIRRMPGGLSLY